MAKSVASSNHLSAAELETISEFRKAWEDYTGKYDAHWEPIQEDLAELQGLLQRAFNEAGVTGKPDEAYSRNVGRSGEERRNKLANAKIRQPRRTGESDGRFSPGGRNCWFSIELSPNYQAEGHRHAGFVRWVIEVPRPSERENWEERKDWVVGFLGDKFDVETNVWFGDGKKIIVDFDYFAPADLENPDDWFEDLVASVERYHDEVDDFLDKNGDDLDDLLEDVGFAANSDGGGKADGGLEIDSPAEEDLTISEITRRQVEHTGAVILQGPPGTGKTHATRELLEELIEERESDKAVNDCQWSKIAGVREAPHHDDDVVEKAREKPVVWDIVQLHPGYSYEDFIRGMGTKSTKNDPAEEGGVHFESKDRILVELAEMAHKLEDDQPVVLILDEINRCNLASVLGELILTLEKDKRSKPGQEASGWPVQLQYPAPDDEGDGGNSFNLPENLWLIGTMNTADRSLAMVDYAIRRRFRFIDVLPDAGAIDNFYGQFDDVEWAEDAAEVAGKVLEGINEHIDESRLKVGHSYFLVSPKDVEGPTDWCDKLAEKIVFEVVPLLREYHREGRLKVGGDGLELSHGNGTLMIPLGSRTMDKETQVLRSGVRNRVSDWLANFEETALKSSSKSKSVLDNDIENEELFDRTFYVVCPELKERRENDEGEHVRFSRRWKMWRRFNFVAGGGGDSTRQIKDLGKEGDLVFVYMSKSPAQGYVGLGRVRDNQAISWEEFRESIRNEDRVPPLEDIPDKLLDDNELKDESYVRVDWLAQIEDPGSNAISKDFLRNAELSSKEGDQLASWTTIYNDLFESPSQLHKKVGAMYWTAMPASHNISKFFEKAPFLLPLLVRAFEVQSEEGKTVEDSFDREQLPADMRELVNESEKDLIELAAQKGMK
jgi:DNA polymerase III delta prime subunit